MVLPVLGWFKHLTRPEGSRTLSSICGFLQAVWMMISKMRSKSAGADEFPLAAVTCERFFSMYCGWQRAFSNYRVS